MKKFVFLAGLSVISANILGMNIDRVRDRRYSSPDIWKSLRTPTQGRRYSAPDGLRVLENDSVKDSDSRYNGDAKIIKSHANGDTSLHLAVKKNNQGLVEKLIAKGVDKEKKDKAGDTPLLVAVKDKNSPFINILISYGANLNAQDANGDTPLHLAVKKTIKAWSRS